MKITNAAAKAILAVMVKKKLNPEQVAFELKLSNGVIGIGFNREMIGKKQQFGKLTVIIDQRIDSEGITIDFAEIGGRKGIIFLGGDDVNHDDRSGNG